MNSRWTQPSVHNRHRVHFWSLLRGGTMPQDPFSDTDTLAQLTSSVLAGKVTGDEPLLWRQPLTKGAGGLDWWPTLLCPLSQMLPTCSQEATPNSYPTSHPEPTAPLCPAQPHPALHHLGTLCSGMGQQGCPNPCNRQRLWKPLGPVFGHLILEVHMGPLGIWMEGHGGREGCTPAVLLCWSVGSCPPYTTPHLRLLRQPIKHFINYILDTCFKLEKKIKGKRRGADLAVPRGAGCRELQKPQAAHKWNRKHPHLGFPTVTLSLPKCSFIGYTLCKWDHSRSTS